MKNLLLSGFILCFSLITLAQGDFEKSSILILPNSELTITGDTNINTFKCDFNPDLLPRETKIKHNSEGSEIGFKNAVLRLNNKGFDCGNKGINKDFHSLLRSEEYPEIELELKKVSLINANSAVADVRIFIAGISNDYRVPVKITETGDQYLMGNLKLNITDFELAPPKKLFGLIKLKDDIEINFNLSVKNSVEKNSQAITGGS